MADATHFRVFDANGHVFHEGKVDPKTGLVEFVAEGEVAHLVFYSGKGDEIVVEGSVDINQTGTVKVSALCPEPART